MDDIIFKVTPQAQRLAKVTEEKDRVAPELYTQHNVMRGLRDLNGVGVLAGLTNISEVYAKATVNGKKVPCPGELYYRGYNVNDLTDVFFRQDTTIAHYLKEICKFIH